MCGRYALTSPPAVIAERFHLLWTPEVERHYNIAPIQTIPVVREGAGQGARAAHAARRHRPSISRVFSPSCLPRSCSACCSRAAASRCRTPDLPAGSTIILVAGVTYLCSLVAGRLLRRSFRPRKRPAER